MDPNQESGLPTGQAGSQDPAPNTINPAAPGVIQPSPAQPVSAQAQNTPASPVAPVTIEQPAQKKPRRKKILVASAVLILIVLLVAGFIFYQNKAQQSAGTKKADEFVALLESGNRETAIDEILKGQGVSRDENPSNQQIIEMVTSLSQNAGLVSGVLQDADAERIAAIFGANSDGEKLIQAHYKIAKDGDTVYFSVTTRLAEEGWVIADLSLSQDDPTN